MRNHSDGTDSHSSLSFPANPTTAVPPLTQRAIPSLGIRDVIFSPPRRWLLRRCRLGIVGLEHGMERRRRRRSISNWRHRLTDLRRRSISSWRHERRTDLRLWLIRLRSVHILQLGGALRLAIHPALRFLTHGHEIVGILGLRRPRSGNGRRIGIRGVPCVLARRTGIRGVHCVLTRRTGIRGVHCVLARRRLERLAIGVGRRLRGGVRLPASDITASEEGRGNDRNTTSSDASNGAAREARRRGARAIAVAAGRAIAGRAYRLTRGRRRC